MISRAAAFALAAEELIGTPFKLHGANRETGLDCVGLVAESLKAANLPVPQLPPYSLRNTDYAFIPEFARVAGFEKAWGDISLGDLVVTIPGPAQRHLLVAGGTSRFIHAHSGLRRVVMMPGPLPWPLWAHFKLVESD